jgi:hypothetical protein
MRSYPALRLLACAGLALLSARAAAPDAWRSELYPADWSPPSPTASFENDKVLQDFSYAGYRAGEAPIPSLQDAPVFDATAPEFGADPAGLTDSTAAIQSAIDAASAAGGGVVLLPAGTYRIAPRGDSGQALRIAADGVVLRGDGPDRTFLLNTATYMRGKHIILVEGAASANWTQSEGAEVPITRELPGPTRDIPVADASAFAPGDTIVIRADPTPEWILEHREPEWIGHEAKLGSILYLRRILSVDTKSNTLRIDAPTRYYLKPRDGARVYKKTGLRREVGVEGLSIGNVQHPGADGWGPLDFAAPSGEYTKRLQDAYGLSAEEAARPKSAHDVHFSYAITFRRVMDGWIRNVSSFRPDGNTTGAHLLSNGVRLLQCRGVTVENAHLGFAQYGGGGGNAYLYRIDDSNECLLADSSAEFSRHGFAISGMACSGNVLWRCRDKDTGLQTGSTGRETTWGKGSDHHMYLSHSNLLDGCVAENSWFEARYRYYEKMSLPRHNLTSAHTVFWNTRGEGGGDRPYLVWSEQARYGYVIGTQGPHSAVRTDGATEDRLDRVTPVDHVEGVGAGETLRPASLFADQRLRRLGAESP